MTARVVAGLEARVIAGPKPSAMDAMVEASKRGYGKAKADAFGQGVIVQNQFNGDLSRMGYTGGTRRTAWINEGIKWAKEEGIRRTGDAA